MVFFLTQSSSLILYDHSYGAKLNSLPIDQLTHPSWALSIELVLRILLLPVPKDFGSQVWYPPPTSHLLEICLPSCLSKPLLSKLFQHQDLSLRKTGCLLTATSLEKLQTVVTELDRLGQSVYPAHTQQWSLAKEELLDQVRRGLPEFQSLISLLGILGTTEVSPSSTETTSIGVSMSEDDLVNLKRRLYQLLASYQTLFPATVRESRFSASKVLSRDMHRLPLDLQYSVLSLVQSSNELKWWQNIEGETSLSVLRALLDYMVSSTQDEIQGLIGTSIQHILSASFPFQSHSAECVIWLSSLSQSSLADQEAILPFIDTILRNAQQEMYKIMDSQFPFYVAERERQRLGTDSMDFDSETGYAPPIGYSTMCLLDGFRHLSQKQKGSTKNLEAIVRYICRVALGIMRSTGTLADMMFSIMRAFLVDLSAMELDAISPAHLGGFVNECLLCLLKYCESYPGTQHADVLPSSEERPAVNPLKLLKDKTATGKLIHVSVKDLKDILSCVSQGSDGLNREWCHELVARLTQTQIGFNELSSLQIPGSLENHIPLSLMLDFSVASSKHAHVLGPRLLQTVKTLTDKSIQAFVFNQAVLELQYGFRISKMTLKQASFLIEVLLSLVQHGSETLLLNQGLQSLLHLCLSQEDWLLSASHVTRSLISLIYSCVREKNQFVVNALRPSLSLIESKITSCLQTSGSEFLQSSMRSDILSIFQATGNEHLIMTAIGCVLENQNIKNVDRLLIDLLKEAVNQQESIDASTFSLVFDKYLNSRSKDLGRIILSLISNVMGLGSEVWNQIEGCRTKNVHANYVPELPVDLTSLITFEHLEKLSKKWDAMSARIASCFAFSNATLRESLYILLENPSHDLEPAVSQIFVGSMLELNVQTEDQFNSIRAWKKSISPLSKIVTECLWGQNFPSSFSRMLESISGKCDIDHLNVRILALGAPVFPPQIDLIAELENNLSVTECTLKTCTVLHEYMPVFVAYSKGRSELILKLLVTTLRLLRGCIMAVKKLTGGTDSSNATEEFLDRVVPLIESIKYLLSLLKESSEILDVTSYHDHFIKFFNVALKTHYTSARMMDLLGCLLQIAGHLSVSQIIICRKHF